MITTIETILLLVTLGLAIETQIVDENIDPNSSTVCEMSGPGTGGTIPPPQ